MPLLLMYLSSFLYPLSLLKKPLCAFFFCFLAVRKPLKMLLLPLSRHYALWREDQLESWQRKLLSWQFYFVFTIRFTVLHCSFPEGEDWSLMQITGPFLGFCSCPEIVGKDLSFCRVRRRNCTRQAGPSYFISFLCLLQLLLRSRQQAVPILCSQGFCWSCAFGAPNSVTLFGIS